MRVGTAGQHFGGRFWNDVSWRWMFVLVAVAIVSARAGEERETASGTIKSTTLKPAATTAISQRPTTPELVAAADRAPSAHRGEKLTAGANTGSPDKAAETPIERALRVIAACHARYDRVEDYTCTFYKRERIAGHMTPLHIMDMKVRTKPQSIYFKFQQPAQGREAIYIAGRHSGKVLAHDVGLNKIIAGTLQLEPTSSRAMEDFRHPITEAGIGPLLETLAKRWAVELNSEESIITFNDDMVVGPRRCTMIESTHPHRQPQFLHHMVRVYIDQEHGLPIRFEAYDWPKNRHAHPELSEEYSYSQLKLNVGLRDIDFDVSNSQYSFGRF
jgi:Protein of unknown function (DUF1571)